MDTISSSETSFRFSPASFNHLFTFLPWFNESLLSHKCKIPFSSRSSLIFSLFNILLNSSLLLIAILAVKIVFFLWFWILLIKLINQRALWKFIFGLNSRGASFLSIHIIPLAIVDQLFQTSALHADNWPPFAKLVSIAA